MITERHRLKEKEYRQKLAEAREKESKWQDDPLKRLEELELLESLKDEMIRYIFKKKFYK